VKPTTALIYHYSTANLIGHSNCKYTAPTYEFLLTATYVLGLDLGYNDPTAMTVVAYNNKYSNKLYIIETFQQSEMLIQEVATKIKELDSRYHFSYMVGDSSSLQVFETISQTYSLPIEKANRQGKLSHQLILNSDMKCELVLFMPGNGELINQLETCTWSKSQFETGKYVEDPKHPNDQVDSFLYAFFYSRHLWFKEPKPILKPEETFLNAILMADKKDKRADRYSNDKSKYSAHKQNWG
jgi:hypothetical protein